MLPEIAIFGLSLALLFAVMQFILPIMGFKTQSNNYFVLTEWAATLQFVVLLVCFSCLAISFINNDFTVNYIAKQSALTLPWYYKIAACWAGHEGSLLLWICIVAFWTCMLVFFAKRMPLAFKATVLGILALMNFGFYVFLFVSSQPFSRNFVQVGLDGSDLNPILQDPGLLFHPPVLYMGYVGFAITFAIAAAGLIHNKIDQQWAIWIKPWVLLSWCSLTLGIVFGSWWAYHVLGWGGWWFWDPVENASLLPWLLATALLHILQVTKNQQQLRFICVLVAILTYIMSLLGTFLVRSGVLISVHTFATDSSRGIFLLAYLLIIATISILLLAYRYPKLCQKNSLLMISRPGLILCNSILLLVMAATVLLGTLYPLILEVLGIAKISVGMPYFNMVFIPLSIPLIFLMGLAYYSSWQGTSIKELLKSIALPLVIVCCLTTGVIIISPKTDSVIIYLGVGLGIWVIISSFVYLFKHSNIKLRLPITLAHLGVGITAIGISITSHYSQTLDTIIDVGEQVKLGNKTVEFVTLESMKSDNYRILQGTFKYNKKHYIYPQRRKYDVSQQITGQMGIKSGIFADVYIVLGEQVDQGWAIRMYYKPLIRWIWFGGILMFLGGMLSLVNLIYNKLRLETKL